MSALIRVMLSGESAQMRPGEWANLNVTVHNLSETVDRYSISVEGVPSSWVEVSRGEMSLFPKEQDQVRVSLRPPESPETRAGRYDLRVVVASQENPGEQTAVPFTLEVQPTTALALALQPSVQRAAKEAVFAVQVDNHGNADLTVLLEATDDMGACYFIFDTPQVVVPAGETRPASLRVRPAVPLQGKKSRLHALTVTARAAEAPALTRQADAQWEERPARSFPWWLLIALLGLAGLAALFFLVLWPLLQPGPAPLIDPTAVPATPTAAPTDRPPDMPTPVPSSAPIVPTVPTPVPTLVPTPDLQAEIEAALETYTQVRAKAETALDPELLRQVCVDPYLTFKVGLVQRNIADGTRWETLSVDWTLLSLTPLSPERVETRVRKTESKVYFPQGATVPDDESCAGPIYSYRDCTYEVRYLLIRQEGRWYVSEVEDFGNCVRKCQQ